MVKVLETRKKFPKHLVKQVEEGLESLRGQLAYVEDALTHDLEKWERKEFFGLKTATETLIEEYEQRLERMV